MSDILSRIRERKLEEIAALKRARPLPALRAEAETAPPPRGFAAAIRAKAQAGELALIAEIKKASPSKGLIRKDFDPAALARDYQRGGAACLSVLTDGPGFQGAGQDLISARSAADLPVIRKDFMYDPAQIYEARAMGADAILVILAAVDDALARDLVQAAADLGMDALIETHDEDEVRRALALPTPLIGVNNRDLGSFETRLETFERLSPLVPPERLAVAESGIFTAAEARRMQAAGAAAILVGESLMRQDDVARAARALLGVAQAP